MKVLVLGATGGTGQRIVQEALAQGYKVTALVRSLTKGEAIFPNIKTLFPELKLIQGDALDREAVAGALSGCDGVISALGTGLSLFHEVTVLSDATRTMIEAMRQQSVHRLVCITGMGAGDSRGHGGFIYDRLILPFVLGKIYRDKDRQEAEIRASNLDWTIVRPSYLTNGPATSNIRVTTNLAGIRGGSIARADVANFVVGEFLQKKWLHKSPLITNV